MINNQNRKSRKKTIKVFYKWKFIVFSSILCHLGWTGWKSVEQDYLFPIAHFYTMLIFFKSKISTLINTIIIGEPANSMS